MKIIKKLLTSFNREEEYTNNVSGFVNSGNFSSETNYFIWVDLKNFRVNIFKGHLSKWKIVNSYICTIGKASTPTPKGTYTIGIKGLYFGVERGYKCWYYTQFKGNYLFHSIIYNINGTVRDGRLGKALSNGCVRLAKENAKWIYDNIPERTKVYIS